MTRSAAAISIATVLAVAAPRGVLARGDAAANREAKDRFQAGARAYKLGNYDQAVDEYKRSYAISAAPLLLYNLGQAYWKLGRFELALHSYQQFLSDAPATSPYRSDAEQHARELRRLLQNKDSWPGGAAQAPTAPPVPPTITIVTPAPAPPPSSRTPAFAAGISLSALALGSLVASIPLVLHGNDLHEQAAAETRSIDRREQLATQSSTYRSAGWAMLGVGSALAVGSAVAWSFFGMNRRHVSVAPEARGASLVLGGTW